MSKTAKTKTPRVLPDLTAEIEKLRKENEALKSRSFSSIKVSTKGGVSVYGLGRFPVTLYKSQWEKLISMVPDVQEFIKANESKLSVKE